MHERLPTQEEIAALPPHVRAYIKWLIQTHVDTLLRFNNQKKELNAVHVLLQKQVGATLNAMKMVEAYQRIVLTMQPMIEKMVKQVNFWHRAPGLPLRKEKERRPVNTNSGMFYDIFHAFQHLLTVLNETKPPEVTGVMPVKAEPEKSA